jgi:RNA polymerase sigma factor (sigma-70 family)
MHAFIESHYRENYKRILKRLVFRAGGIHQAEDILQEAYSRAIQYFNSIRVEEFDKWFSIVVNNCYNHYMRDEIGLSYIDEDDEPLGSIDCSMYGDQVRKEVYELIKTKSENQIEILMLHLKQGYSPIDISRITDHSYANIHKVIQRFKQEIKDLYG